MEAYNSKDYETGPLNLLRVEKLMIQSALKRSQGIRAKAARSLKISEKTLRDKIKRHGIN